MGKIKKILENELTGGTQSTEVYPITSIKAVYDENNERLDNIIDRKDNEIQKELEAEVARATNAESNLRETINNITEINENATSANIVTIDTIPNTSSSNVQQALNELFKTNEKQGIYNLDTNVPLSSEQFYTSTTARNAVPTSIRKLGLIITYKIDAATSIIEQFIGASISNWQTDTNWKNVGSDGGNKIIEWNTDFATTREQVPLKERKAGMIISYKHPQKGWVNEQYIGTNTNDANWVKDENWTKLATIKDYEEAIENIKVTPSMTTFMDGNVESIFDNIENSQLIAENSALMGNIETKTWSIISGSNRIYKIPIDGTKSIYYNRNFTTDYPKMYELDRNGNLLNKRSFSKYSNVSVPKAGGAAKYIVFELENAIEPSEFWMSYVDVLKLSSIPIYNKGFSLSYKENWKAAARAMINELIKEYFLPTAYEKTARFSLQQNNIAKIILGRYRNSVQTTFSKGYIYILKSIHVNGLGNSEQANDMLINALNSEQTISTWGYYNVLAIDAKGQKPIIDDTLIKVKFAYNTEVVIRENTNHIYAIGDSLTDSSFTTYKMSYIAKLKEMYKDIFNFISFRAIFGYTTTQELNSLQQFYNSTIDINYGQFNNWQNRIENYQVTTDRFKGFSIYIGTNDIIQQTDLATFTSTYTEMIAYIKEKFIEANIFVIVPPKCNKKANAIDYCNAIKTICDENSIGYVDLSVIDELDSTKPDYSYSDYYLEQDCVHFNQAGWDLVNALVIPKFTEVMQNKLIDEVNRLSFYN